MSLEQTPVLLTSNVEQHNRFQYCPYGMALLNGGLCQIVSINGIGLVTDGFIWQGPAVWFDAQAYSTPVTTTWSASYGYAGSSLTISTGWTASIGYSGSASLISTSWTASQNFGDEFPLS
jgi:hypothetical protein